METLKERQSSGSTECAGCGAASNPDTGSKLFCPDCGVDHVFCAQCAVSAAEGLAA